MLLAYVTCRVGDPDSAKRVRILRHRADQRLELLALYDARRVEVESADGLQGFGVHSEEAADERGGFCCFDLHLCAIGTRQRAIDRVQTGECEDERQRQRNRRRAKTNGSGRQVHDGAAVSENRHAAQ